MSDREPEWLFAEIRRLARPESPFVEYRSKTDDPEHVEAARLATSFVNQQMEKWDRCAKCQYPMVPDWEECEWCADYAKLLEEIWRVDICGGE